MAIQGCSVYKASSNEGVSVNDIKKCNTKGCLLSLGMDVVSGKLNPKGQFVEIFRGKARKSGGNYLRAVEHGIMDVGTLGLWEVVGTPVEGAISNNLGFITAIATFDGDNDLEYILRTEIYDAHGRRLDVIK